MTAGFIQIGNIPPEAAALPQPGAEPGFDHREGEEQKKIKS